MFFVKLAARNVLRHYGRTLLSMVSIVAGVAIIILGRGLTSGLKENVIRAQIDTVSGHVLVVPGDYPTTGMQHPVDNLLTIDAATAGWLDENSVAWTKRLIFVPQVVRGPDAMRVRATGFDPVLDEQVFSRELWRVDGRIPKTQEDGVLVARGVASVFSIKPGDRIVMTSRTSAGAINALEVPVSGVLSASNPMIDTVGVFVPMPLARELLRSEEAFSHLSVKLDNRNRAHDMVGELTRRLGQNARVTTWEEESRSAAEAQELRQMILDTIAFALIAIAATGIANTVLMAAYERVREIGTLRAMGMTRRGVVGLFVGEGLFMGVIGSTVGAAIGAALVYRFSQQGIDISPMMEKAASQGGYDSVPFSTMLYTSFSMSSVVGAAIFGVAVAVLSSIYPAVLASGRPPAEAVRAE